MTNWSGFYDDPGPEDTDQAAYISDMAEWVKRGDIAFAPNAQIILFGCDLGGSFSLMLSAATGCTVIAADGGSYPQIAGNQETGVFISTSDWKVYTNGSFAYSAGSIYNAW